MTASKGVIIHNWRLEAGKKMRERERKKKQQQLCYRIKQL